MMIRTVVKMCAILALCSSCTFRENEPAREQTDNQSVDTITPVTTDDEARARAVAFLRDEKREWGQPVGVLRTVSNWYRVEFSNAHGRERVVLVNPENGRAELPLRR
jgi:hypothetical protein